MATEPRSLERRDGTGKITAKAVLQQVHNTMDNSFARSLDPVMRFAEKLPALSGNMLELHFDRHAPAIDFAIRVSKHFDQKMNTQPALYNYEMPMLPNFPFAHGVENIWIEYDNPFRNAPALFFDIGKDEVFCPEKTYASFREVISIYDFPEDKSLLGFLQKVKELDICVVYYGLMFSRSSRAVRLTINGVSSSNLAQALSELGWKGNYNAVKKICRQYLHQEQKIVVAVDFEERLQSRIGIEIFDYDFKHLIELFGSKDLIGPEYMSWLKKWACIRDMPDDLSHALSQQHNRCIKELHNRINHFKFVLNDTENVLLKGYLYYCF